MFTVYDTHQSGTKGVRKVNLQVVMAHEILQPDFGNLP